MVARPADRYDDIRTVMAATMPVDWTNYEVSSLTLRLAEELAQWFEKESNGMPASDERAPGFRWLAAHLRGSDRAPVPE